MNKNILEGSTALMLNLQFNVKINVGHVFFFLVYHIVIDNLKN